MLGCPRFPALPAPRVPAVGCKDAAQRPSSTAWSTSAIWAFCPGQRVRRQLLLPVHQRQQQLVKPTVSTSGSWPFAPSRAAPSATKNRPGPRRRRVACGPCPRCPFSPATRWSQATFQAPRARLPTALQPPVTSGGSSPQAARDAGSATDWRGAASRHCEPLPVVHRGCAGCYQGLCLLRLGHGLPGIFCNIPRRCLACSRPAGLAADDRRWPANSPWPGHG